MNKNDFKNCMKEFTRLLTEFNTCRDISSENLRALKGNIMNQRVALKPKQYAYRTEYNEENKV